MLNVVESLVERRPGPEKNRPTLHHWAGIDFVSIIHMESTFLL